MTEHSPAEPARDPGAPSNNRARLVSQAGAIKALSHPLRIRLLDLLAQSDELTATQCAAATGASVASCSFHLRQLEQYGHVTRAEQHGKERPWRLVSRGYAIRPDFDDPDALKAAQGFGSLWLADEFARLHQWIAAADRDDPAWVHASVQTSAELWATRDELAELSRQVEHLANAFRERTTNPAARPAGARKAHVFGAAWADIPDDTEQNSGRGVTP